MLLTYHLIISSVIPTQDVDIDLAERILKYNLARYPDGVFFLYFSGRLFSTQTQASKAIGQYQYGRPCQPLRQLYYVSLTLNLVNSKALKIQTDAGTSFKQIQHIVRWDLSLTHLSLGNYINAHESLNILAKESNWSKAVYSYGRAVTMYEILKQESPVSADEQSDMSIRELQLREVMKTIPGFVQRIAGKSLPIEVSIVSSAARPHFAKIQGTSEIRSSQEQEIPGSG